MVGNTESQRAILYFLHQQGTSRRMIDPRSLFQDSLLESRAIFPDVMI